jgi:sugar phosphate isomerase/epimerase
MSLSNLPPGYCTNVHPGRTLAEVEQGLDRFTVPVRERLGGPLAAGLWLARSVTRELLSSADRLPRFAEDLRRRGLECYTLNAFPYGDFHSERVKENVYLPDWSEPERLDYTRDCARILAALLPDGTEGSISTVPLGFKGFEHNRGFLDRAAEQLIELAIDLHDLRERTSRLVRLAIEPEPFCLLETTAETLEFFDRLRKRAADLNRLELVEEHIGVCYDVCHQAVEFEDVEASIRSLAAAGIRINKVHLTCAIELEQPAENPEARQALARYAEPRYLHQTLARTSEGRILRLADLTEQAALEPEPAFLHADRWRVHFHVPVDAERLGPLGTTRGELRRALGGVAALDYAPHLEVETYTWQVLPGGPAVDLVDGITRELRATRELLTALEPRRHRNDAAAGSVSNHG